MIKGIRDCHNERNPSILEGFFCVKKSAKREFLFYLSDNKELVAPLVFLVWVLEMLAKNTDTYAYATSLTGPAHLLLAVLFVN